MCSLACSHLLHISLTVLATFLATERRSPDWSTLAAMVSSLETALNTPSSSSLVRAWQEDPVGPTDPPDLMLFVANMRLTGSKSLDRDLER